MLTTRKFNFVWIPVLLLVLLSAGHAAKKKTVSPFLGDISGFKRSSERKTLLVERHSTKRAIDYQKMMFEPVVIFQSPHSKYRQLSSEDKTTLSNLFRTYELETFKGVIEIVETPGEGVLDVRCAIRGLKRGNYHMNSKGSKKITPDSKMPAGTFEMEAVDSVSKERIIAVIDEIGQEKLAKANQEKIVPTVKVLFLEWIEMLRNVFRQEKYLSTIPT